MTIVLVTQFHVYLSWVKAYLSYRHKWESPSRRFQPGEGAGMGLLRDCTTLNFTKVCLAQVSTQHV